MGFPCGSAGKESACNVGDLGSIPGLGRSPGEGKGYPLQNSGLENSMDCIVHGVAKRQTQLSHFHFDFDHTDLCRQFKWNKLLPHPFPRHRIPPPTRTPQPPPRYLSSPSTWVWDPGGPSCWKSGRLLRWRWLSSQIAKSGLGGRWGGGR